MPPLDDAVLLAALGSALAPQQVEPGPEAMATLHQALQARRPDATEDSSAVVIAFAPPKRRSTTWAGIHRLRQPVVAALAVGVLATSGVAAAGVATDHLPGPTRNVAYALGLPVTSPALASAKGTLAHLRVALAAHDVAQVQAIATLLRTQLAGLSAADRDSIKAMTNEQLSLADNLGPVVANGLSSGPASSNGTTRSGTSSSNGQSTNGTGNSSDGSPSGTAGSSEGSPGGTTPGPTSPGTTEPGDGSSGGSSSTTTTPTPTSSPTTTPGPTPTTEPGEKGDGIVGGTISPSTTGTTGTTALN
jgi:hypothetical protein